MKIFHIADLHFRNYIRFEEYENVANELYKIARERNPDRIVIAGDIFDTKTILSPEVTKSVYNFFFELSKICEVDILPGNHDANLSNKNRMCSIDAIMYFLRENKKLHYYPKSGLYNITNDIVYGIFSLLEPKDKYPVNIPNKDNNKTYIALYHGTLQGAKNDDGYVIESDNNPNELFKNYDFALLGDIHSRLFLDPVTVTKEIDESELENYKNELNFKII
jgi:DNA repair exonuclease SbcCD nuclease subunit